MSLFLLHQQMLPAPELITDMTGSNKLIGTLLHAPVKLVMDNQSSDSVVLFIDIGGGQVQWKTFEAHEAIVLDDDAYSFPVGTSFYGNGTAAGNFSISYTYIKYPE